MSEDKAGFPPNESTGLAWLLAEWSGALASAIKGMAGDLAVTEIARSGDVPQGDGSLWWAQRFSLVDEPCVWIGTGETGWTQIAERGAAAAGLDAIGTVSDTFREILTQSLVGLAASLTKRLGEEITCTRGEETSAPPDAGVHGFVDVTIGNGEPVRMCLIAGSELLRTLHQEHAGKIPVTQLAQDGQDVSTNGEPGVAAFPSVLDVELPVSISLGTTQLFLEEVLKLGEGSVVPLGREASELVILRVNGRVVARGEMVVARGHYGLRIQELSSLSERLEQLDTIRWPQGSNASAS
jgi:flagellar motor switch protein FliN